MNDWLETRIVQNVANENNEIMNRNQNWVVGERTIGVRKKRIYFFFECKLRQDSMN